MGPESTPSRAVLIVDDDRALRHALSALLTAAGHHIESVGDGPEALALLESSRARSIEYGIGQGAQFALWTRANLCNGLGRYEEALTAACHSLAHRWRSDATNPN